MLVLWWLLVVGSFWLRLLLLPPGSSQALQAIYGPEAAASSSKVVSSVLGQPGTLPTLLGHHRPATSPLQCLVIIKWLRPHQTWDVKGFVAEACAEQHEQQHSVQRSDL